MRPDSATPAAACRSPGKPRRNEDIAACRSLPPPALASSTRSSFRSGVRSTRMIFQSGPRPRTASSQPRFSIRSSPSVIGHDNLPTVTPITPHRHTAHQNRGRANFFYRTSTREPTIRQLQPFVDNSNPLRIYMGNPALTPEYRHRLNLQYSLYRGYSGLTLRTDLGSAYTHNSIVRVRAVGSGLRQSVSAVNSGAAWSADGGVSVRMPIRRLGMEWYISGRTNLETDTEFINDVENESRLLRNSLRLDLDYYLGAMLEVTTSGRITWNDVSYSLNDALNQRYFNSRVNAEVRWNPDDSWMLESSLHYRILDRDVFDDSQNIALLNLALSRLFLAGKGNLRLELNDMLNQNQGVTITNAATYIQESRIESLGRYLMLKVTYKPKLM